jgi:membrane-associated phospholipid phosphatase
MRSLYLYVILIFSLSAHATTRPEVFDGFWKNTAESFTKNPSYHLTALGLTPALIYSGVDAKVQTAFNGSKGYWSLPGVSAGYLAPFVIALPLYGIGEAKKDDVTIGAAYAVAQTTIITLSTVSLLKSFTGRPEPDNSSSTSMQRQSREFNFGFLNRGIYNGWPSGHMATITSIASTLIHYYPEKTWVKYAGYTSMSYMLVMVSAEHQGQFHWFSDGVAGGLMGYAIGKTVGQNMRSKVLGIEPVIEKETVEVVPIFGPGRSGVQVVWTQ